uniref:small monomeric GTPase n=1 Tax=Poecilia formosa TaxID=48698 RepID=A0A096LQG0_POEFO
MSRKKAAKGKGTSKSPKASPSSGRTAKGLAAAGAPSSALVYPSRPSISNSGEFYDIAFKVMLVGDSGVGKTCLLVRFKDGAFLAGSFISTVGIDFRNKVMTIDSVKVKLQVRQKSSGF